MSLIENISWQFFNQRHQSTPTISIYCQQNPKLFDQECNRIQFNVEIHNILRLKTYDNLFKNKTIDCLDLESICYIY